jgi:hypothetical protein
MFLSSENFSICKGSRYDCLYTPSSRHKHGAAFCKGLGKTFRTHIYLGQDIRVLQRVEGSVLNCTGFLAALEEEYEMGAYILAGIVVD